MLDHIARHPNSLQGSVPHSLSDLKHHYCFMKERNKKFVTAASKERKMRVRIPLVDVFGVAIKQFFLFTLDHVSASGKGGRNVSTPQTSWSNACRILEQPPALSRVRPSTETCLFLLKP